MAIYKRGSIYWYKFTFNGEAIRESTRQKNQHKAKDMESTHRSRLAMGEVGIREKKVIPTLKSFCVDRVEPWAKSTFEHASPKTWLWYKFGIDSLKKSATLANLKLDEIGPEFVAEYASERQRDGLQTSSVNSCLRALRRVLRLAVEWGVLEASPKVKFLSGEHRRERVIPPKKRRCIWRLHCHCCTMFLWFCSIPECAPKSATASDGKTSLGMVGETECC